MSKTILEKKQKNSKKSKKSKEVKFEANPLAEKLKQPPYAGLTLAEMWDKANELRDERLKEHLEFLMR